MKAIIMGRNRAVIGKVKLKEWEAKHWYLCGTQLYKMYPDGLTRTIITRYGVRKADEEVIIYKENGTIPYHSRGVSYSTDKVLSEIDEHKLMTSTRPVGIFDLVMRHRRDINAVIGYLPILIGAGIVLFAVVANGFH